MKNWSHNKFICTCIFIFLNVQETFEVTLRTVIIFIIKNISLVQEQAYTCIWGGGLPSLGVIRR